VFALAIGYVVLLSRTQSWLGRALVPYTAYLIHPLCIVVVSERLGFDLGHAGTSYAQLLASALLATLVASAPVYLLVERPLMALRPGGFRA